MSYPLVTLTPIEAKVSELVGIERYEQSIRAGLKDAYGCDRTKGGKEADINSAGAECACAKYLNVFWCGHVKRFGLPDVDKFDVKSSTRSDGRLIVRPNSDDDQLFVLVLGKIPNYRIIGWTDGRTGKLVGSLEEYNSRPPAYYVSHPDLNKPELLKQMVNK